MGCKKSKPGDVITATRRVRPANVGSEVENSSVTPIDETDALGGTIDFTNDEKQKGGKAIKTKGSKKVNDQV